SDSHQAELETVASDGRRQPGVGDGADAVAEVRSHGSDPELPVVATQLCFQPPPPRREESRAPPTRSGRGRSASPQPADGPLSVAPSAQDAVLDPLALRANRILRRVPARDPLLAAERPDRLALHDGGG